MFICPFILCACHLLSKSTGFCLHKKKRYFFIVLCVEVGYVPYITKSA